MDDLTPQQKQMLQNWYYNIYDGIRNSKVIFLDIPEELIYQIDKTSPSEFLWRNVKKYVIDLQIKDGHLKPSDFF